MTKPKPKPKVKAPDRTDVWCTRLNKKESAQCDAMRRSLTRAQWVRWLIIREIKNQREQEA